MYLATEDAGLLESNDGGVTTRPMNQGFVNRNLTALVAGSKDLYTTSLYSHTDNGIRRLSTEGNWAPAGPQPSNAMGNILSVAAVSSTKLFARTYDAVISSLDGGKTWTALRVPWRDKRIHALEVIPGKTPSPAVGNFRRPFPQ